MTERLDPYELFARDDWDIDLRAFDIRNPILTSFPNPADRRSEAVEGSGERGRS